MAFCLCGGNIEGYIRDTEDYSQGGMGYPRRSWVRVAKVVGELCGEEVLWKTEWLTTTGNPGNTYGPYVWTNGAYLVAHPPLFCGRAGRMNLGILRVTATIAGVEYGPIDLRLNYQSRTWVNYTLPNNWLTSGIGSVTYSGTQWCFGGFSYQCTYFSNQLIIRASEWPVDYRPDLIKFVTENAFFYKIFGNEGRVIASGYWPGGSESTGSCVVKLGEYASDTYFYMIDITRLTCTDGLPNLHSCEVCIDEIWLSSCLPPA